jgi:hypothetical protein
VIAPVQIPDSEKRFRTGAEFVYWVGLPLVFGLMIGWFRVGYVDADVKLAVLSFWVGFVLFSWCSCGLYTWFAKILLRPWQPSLWFLTLFGTLVIGLVNVYPMNQLLILGQAYLPQQAVPMGPMVPEWSGRFLAIYLSAVLPGALLWTGINLLYDRVLGIPRFRYSDTVAGVEATPANQLSVAPDLPVANSALLRRLGSENRGELLALQAQEHYVMVYTDKGSELLSYSFGNALLDVAPGSGIQVHRSWWVAAHAVERMERVADKWQLQLNNELTVPVSRSYVSEAKRAFN